MPAVGRRDWAQAHFAAEVMLLRHLATSPLAESGTGDVAWVVAGVESNTHNGVTDARLNSETAASAIASTIERFTARQLPATWFLDEDSTPADLGSFLQDGGCRPERSAWVMGAAVADLLDEVWRLPDGVVVEEVTTPSQLDSWFEAAAGVTFGDAPPSAARQRTDTRRGRGRSGGRIARGRAGPVTRRPADLRVAGLRARACARRPCLLRAAVAVHQPVCGCVIGRAPPMTGGQPHLMRPAPPSARRVSAWWRSARTRRARPSPRRW